VKKIKSILIPTLTLFLLTGCGTSSNYQKLMSDGDKATSAKNYVQAAKDYQEAIKLNNKSPDAGTKLITARQSEHDALVSAGTKALANKKYDEAIKDFTEAENYGTDKKTLEALISKANTTKDTGKIVDDYLTWLNNANSQNTLILNKWQSLSDQLTTGAITQSQLLKSAENLFAQESDMLKSANDETLKLDTGLAQQHLNYVQALTSEHQTLAQIITDLKTSGTENSQIISDGQGLTSIPSDYTNYKQNLNQYFADQQAAADAATASN
jgi:tetratricopeptide (TPR) repeat protein